MNDEFWLKYGFKENGELVCVRTLSNLKPTKEFFYNDNGTYKDLLDTNVIKITKDVIKLLINDKQEEK